jgi:hypothetical protein
LPSLTPFNFRIPFRRYNGSSWTGCVNDVGQGILDVCVGDYWTTADRASIAPFTLPFFDEEWFLMVPRTVTTKVEILSQIERPAAPFSPGLWAAIFATTIYCALLHHYLLSKSDLDHWTQKNNSAVKLRSRKKTILKYLLEAITVGIDMDDEGSDQPHTNLGQAVLKIAFAMIMVITTASYTAQLAAILSNTAAKPGTITNIQDCVEQQCTLCAHKHRMDFLERAYPTLKPKLVPFRGTWGIIDEMEQFGSGMRGSGGSGYYYADKAKNDECIDNNKCIDAPEERKCDAYFVSSKEFEDRFRPILCDFEFKGGPIYWLPISLPVAEKYAAPLSYAIRDLEEQEPFKDIRDEYLTSGDAATQRPTCDPFKSSDVDVALAEKTPDQLTVAHFGGPWALLFFATIFSVSHKLFVESEYHKAVTKTINKRMTGLKFKSSDLFGEDRMSEMVENPAAQNRQDSSDIRFQRKIDTFDSLGEDEVSGDSKNSKSVSFS